MQYWLSVDLLFDGHFAKLEAVQYAELNPKTTHKFVEADIVSVACEAKIAHSEPRLACVMFVQEPMTV